MSRRPSEDQLLSRRALLKGLGMAPLLLRPAPFFGVPLLSGPAGGNPGAHPSFPFSDVRLTPHYPSRSPLEDVLRLVAPGSDDYVTEKYAWEIQTLLRRWSGALTSPVYDSQPLTKLLHPSLAAVSLVPQRETVPRKGNGIDITRRSFGAELVGLERFRDDLHGWLGGFSRIETAEFEVTSIDELGGKPPTVRIGVRYDLVGQRQGAGREERVGKWRMEWSAEGPEDAANRWTIRRWEASEETVSVTRGRFFEDVTNEALGGTESYGSQLQHGTDYWRTVLDGACGIDVYGNNGVAAGDYDNDGFDDLYVCQPAGLPNRLYRNRGDGTFEDVTDKAGVGVLESTACALFADFRNAGLQDLLVVRGSGPLLFVNQGNGTFALKRDAFQFAQPPQGTFTHAALADYDGDGRLDIYFCLYSYYLGLDQYHYPVPYFDARNGPPNFLLHNQGDGTFADRTEAAGLNAENDRYSFACAWGKAETRAGAGSFPDLYVANDFGRNNLYRNNGDGTFRATSDSAHAQDVGAGMSACWVDCDNDGRQDVYVANMWSAAGQRVAGQTIFHAKAPEETRALYRRHARGNALYRNVGKGRFENASQQAGVEMGRWAWCSDFWDFDHDGYPDLYVANGYISAPEKEEPQDEPGGRARGDLGSFFWRQVVAKSPEDSTPSLAYEHGWNALNELIRSDSSWSGFERNVMFANNRDGTFSEVSGAVGLDFLEDSRAFALADLDHDGRLEVTLKNRNAPQLRILHNSAEELGNSIAFRLRGTRSNRDAIGAAITLEAGTLRQTKYLQAGSGFLAQHSKEIFFGVGGAEQGIRATVRWPSGLVQDFENIPANRRIELTESVAIFTARPFAPAAAAYGRPAALPKLEQLPTQVETWLIEPLKAPEFSLPDMAGEMHTLSQMRGRSVLLAFWSHAAPASLDSLKLMYRHRSGPAHAKLPIVAIHVDEGGDREAARSFVTQERFDFPVLFASEDVAGIYNIIYRYLFDRRRNLPLPATFLLDKEGMIVAVFQGATDAGRLAQALHAGTADPAERLRRAIPFSGVQQQNAFLRNDFTYGVAMFQHGYLDEAAESFQQAVAAKPDGAEGYYNLGTLSLRRNNYAEARTYLEKTLQLRPNYPEAWNNLGMMAAQEGKADEAITDFQRSLQLRPGYATALLNLGNVYRRQKVFDKAQDCLQRALSIQPDDPEVNYSLGMFYAQQSQLPQAADYLRRALELRPDYPEALNNLGVLFVREQDYARAEKLFKDCIRLTPAFDQSYINLSRLYAMQQDRNKAKDVLEQLLRLQPQNTNASKALEMLNAIQ